MQDDIASEYPNQDITILSINMIGAESGIALIPATDHLPIVNDDVNTGIWSNWGGGWRDVFILDRQNEIYSIYNLTQNNLAPGYGVCTNSTFTNQEDCTDSGGTWTENYDYLKQLFVLAATQ